ncbi:MAG: hypothetical protein CBB68_10330 [Rhodospirillaceae bacterium TMED8]|nr:IclR family transcriptional regulator [Magnetovibrio sp.]OUT50246.1 MAG: hypothetical protein CBB68_10330 [Rhodospirillaceae bacterium TMED8]|tara:strand:+ start:824 stop:1612 length:789 start_codon:yes stop_codon:yes gene_type:complete
MFEMKVGSENGSRSIRVLELLEALVKADRPLRVADLMVITGLPKATVHRLAGLLENTGFLEPDLGTKGVTIGHRGRDLALGLMSMEGRNGYRHRILADLSAEIGETCNLNVPVGSEILYLDRVETQWPLRTELAVGTRVPLHCTASGKLYLASMPAAKRMNLINSLALDSRTQNTITTAKKLAEEVEAVRLSKIGTDNEEFVTGLVAAGVPITDKTGRLAAVLAFHVPAFRMDMNEALTFLPALQRAALKLSAEFVGPINVE